MCQIIWVEIMRARCKLVPASSSTSLSRFVDPNVDVSRQVANPAAASGRRELPARSRSPIRVPSPITPASTSPSPSPEEPLQDPWEPTSSAPTCTAPPELKSAPSPPKPSAPTGAAHPWRKAPPLPANFLAPSAKARPRAVPMSSAPQRQDPCI